MAGFVKVVPNGDILPSRSKYSTATNDWQMGINHLYGEPADALWFPIPDVVASVLMTGRIPQIVDAFWIEASGTLPGLAPTKLRGEVAIDPRTEDFYKVIVEERKRRSSHRDLSDIERKKLDKSLKILASATAYGIYAQMDRQDDDHKVKVTCYGIDPEPFTCSVVHPDLPSEYAFPPLASLITGGARLMLALLEHSVSELEGTYVMEDTDSMAIVATEDGGIVPCSGGLLKLQDGRSAVRALSWKQVQEVSARFARLSPYANKSESILKIEKDNFDPVTGQQRHLRCFAISAKRYALFLTDDNGDPILLQKGLNNHEDRWSQHGLGHLRNPTDLESEDRDWIRQVWTNIVRGALNLARQPLGFEHLPAIGRITITSPVIMGFLKKVNVGKKHRDRLKPFDLLLSCHVKQFGHPPGVDLERFHLVGPYEPNLDRWLEMFWIDQYTGERYLITTSGFYGQSMLRRLGIA